MYYEGKAGGGVSDLGLLLRGDAPLGVSLVYGVVATVTPLTVTVAPSTVAVPVASHRGIGCRVGDKVTILQQGVDRVVIGIAEVAPPWTLTTGTVSFSGSTANVTSYRRHRVNGDVVECEFGWLTTGAVTAGLMLATLPYTPAGVDGGGNAVLTWGHVASAVEQGVAHRYAHIVSLYGSAQLVVTLPDYSANWGATVPHTWKSTDYGVIRGISYRV